MPRGTRLPPAVPGTCGSGREHDEEDEQDLPRAVTAPPSPRGDRRQNVERHGPRVASSAAGIPDRAPRMAAVRTTAELREGFQAFFEEKGHLRCPSASLIPRADDRSTLYTSAGMQPQMPYFLGREAPPAPLTTTCQKVFRTPDIDEVGLDTFHLTFFEMLGNFSFGRYFKEGAIEYATEFIKERLRLDWDRVWISVHAGD